MKRRPKLKSKYQGRVEKAIEYAKTIESWENLVDPCTLAFFCLGPCNFQVVTAPSGVVDDSIRSFPRGPELSLVWVFCCC